MSSINELLAAVNQHLEEGAIEDALILCRQALAKAPRAPRVLKIHGACLMASGDMQGAQASFAAALAIDPDDGAACHDLGLAQHALRDLEAAQASLERALTLAPQNAASHEALATVLMEQGNMDGAIRHMLVAVELNPDDAGTLSNFASVLSRIGAFYDARVHFERALELDPGNANVILPLAHILHELGEHMEAVALVERAYLKRPRDPMTLAALAYGLAQIGEYDRALTHVEAALKAAPDFIPALDALALLAAYRGEPEKGIAHLGSILRGQKANRLLYLSTAAAMGRDGRHADAMTLAREGLDNSMTRGGAYVLMRQSLALLGRFEEMVALGKSFGAGLKALKPGAEDAVIVPLETKPLEAVLLARFLGHRRSNDAGPTTEAVIYAPDAIAPLLERVDSGRRVLPLSGADMARPGAAFIAQYATDERLLDYAPARFAPYVQADPRADDFWRGSLAPFKRPFVAITWGKYPPAPLLHDLDLALRDWPGTVFSLTWDDQRAELEGNKRIIDAGRHLQSLDALIDLIGQLDYIVAPDGLAMHIAGAMGVPGLVLTNPDKPWYWYDEDGRSYWYPSISVLTRTWQETMEDFRPRIAEASQAFLESKGAPLSMPIAG
jgi:tetratricopeptide (TPR) repeat protein